MKRSLILMMVMLFAFEASAASANEKIGEIVGQYKLGNVSTSVYAVSTSKNKVLADLNATELLNPASCMKLVTTAVALKNLGPDHQFPIDFYLNGSDLWVKGFGDPSLVIERLEEMVDHLIKSGLPASLDNIYIDDTYFDKGGFPGRQKRSARSYNALTSAVALNYSAITVEVFPGEKIGKPANIKVDAPGMAIENRTKTVAKGRTNIKISRLYTKEGDTIFVSGQIPVSSIGKKQFFNVTNPAEHFGTALKEMLIERGSNVTGVVIKTGVLPKTAKLVLAEKSPPLKEIIKNMNKLSNNFMAEQIVKTLGAKISGEPGTTEKGMQSLQKYLAGLGGKDFFIENGSGLSYENKVSAHDLWLVLNDIYKDKKLRDVFIDSLSVFGLDGTLKRSNSNSLNGHLHAKTGSLNGVSSLAGFLSDKDDMILFVIMLNGNKVDFVTGRKITQKIVEMLVSN